LGFGFRLRYASADQLRLKKLEIRELEICSP